MKVSFSPPKLMGHIVAGFPSLDLSLKAALGICEAGASYLEVQFPFSDPSADGVDIQQACAKALASGFSTNDGFTFISQLCAKIKERNLPTKIIIMTYANVVFAYSVKAFLQEAKKSGVWGIIVPDLPLDSDESLHYYARESNINVILLITPLTPIIRIRYIASRSDKIVYAVARTGITGQKTLITRALRRWLETVRKVIKKPIALGFGISSNEQVRSIGYSADIIVAGSYFVRHIAENANTENLEERMKICAEQLMQWDNFPPPPVQQVLFNQNEIMRKLYQTSKKRGDVEYRRVIRDDVVDEEPPRKVFYIQRHKK